MQLYVKNGRVLAWHPADQAVQPSVYGAGVLVIPIPATITLQRTGSAPPPGQTDTRPYAAPDPTPALLKAAIAAMRFYAETGGITLNDAPVPTDRAAQAQFTGLKAFADDQPTISFDFKNADGSFTTVNAAAITTLARAVAAHVQACFTAEKTAAAAVDAGTITTFDGVTSLTWPS